jgi:hypothetical protein
MTGRRLVGQAAVVVALGMAALLTAPKPAAAMDPPCGQCTTADVCLFSGDFFCSITCGLPYAGCVVKEECGSYPMAWIICADAS